MNLTVGERLTLLQVLPQEGDITTIRIVAKLREDLSFNDEEHAALGFEFTDAGVKWNGEAEPNRDYEFGAKSRDVITKALDKMNKDGKLRAEHLSVCDKFGIGTDD